MSEMDEFLEQLKAEYKPKKPPSSSSKAASSASPLSQKSHQNLDSPKDRQVDNILAELKSEFTTKKPPEKKISPQKQVKPTSVSRSSSKRSTPTYNDNLLAEIKGEYQAEIKAEQQRKQRELLEEQRREQAKEQRRRQALKKEAQEWLKTIDLKSDEGLWFEEFSYSYDSKLEAAIDYLQAIRETRRLG